MARYGSNYGTGGMGMRYGGDYRSGGYGNYGSYGNYAGGSFGNPSEQGYSRYDQGYTGSNRHSGWLGGNRSGFAGRAGFGTQNDDLRQGAGYSSRNQGYGDDFGYYGGGMGESGMYDEEYKSRWQTDYGDPFGDRQSHTPIRVMRGGYPSHGGHGASYPYDSEFDQGFRSGGYGGDYRSGGYGSSGQNRPYRGYGQGGGYGGWFGSGYSGRNY